MTRILYAVFLIVMTGIVADAPGSIALPIDRTVRGKYLSEGLYRPAPDCLLFTRSAAFCAVCAAAIGKVIDECTLPQ